MTGCAFLPWNHRLLWGCFFSFLKAYVPAEWGHVITHILPPQAGLCFLFGNAACHPTVCTPTAPAGWRVFYTPEPASWDCIEPPHNTGGHGHLSTATERWVATEYEGLDEYKERKMRPRTRAPYVTRGPRNHLENSGLSLALTGSSTLPGHLQDSPHHGCLLNGKCDSQGSLFSTWEETPVLPSSSTTQPPHPFSVAFLFIPLWNLTAPPLAPVHTKRARGTII